MQQAVVCPAFCNPPASQPRGKMKDASVWSSRMLRIYCLWCILGYSAAQVPMGPGSMQPYAGLCTCVHIQKPCIRFRVPLPPHAAVERVWALSLGVVVIVLRARSGGQRRRSYGVVREPAQGFFVTGSSLKDMNGVYKRVETVRYDSCTTSATPRAWRRWCHGRRQVPRPRRRRVRARKPHCGDDARIPHASAGVGLNPKP